MAKQADTASGPGARILRRRLGALECGADGLPRILDAVAVPPARPDEAARVVVIAGAGSRAGALAPDGAPGCALPLDLREVPGGVLAWIAGGAGPLDLALADGGRVAVQAAAAEWGFLAGRDCVLSFRLEESATQVAMMLGHHARTHGLQGAVIVCRVPPPEGFAEDLAKALSATTGTDAGRGGTGHGSRRRDGPGGDDIAARRHGECRRGRCRPAAYRPAACRRELRRPGA